MIVYLIKSILSLGILLGIYRLFLEREKMHRFNRFYLLASVIFSLLCPSVVINISPEVVEHGGAIAGISGSEYLFSWNNILVWLSAFWLEFGVFLVAGYILISGVLILRILFNLRNIVARAYHHERIDYNGAKMVLVPEKILPHSFLNFIFINKSEYESQKVEQELLTHELTHVNQKHTLDILFLELLQAVFWFNPLLVFLKKAVRLNHEFLADEATISSHYNIAGYQQLLLSKATGQNAGMLTSSLNYALTRKRFLMMSKSGSPAKMLFKKIALIPVLAIMVLVFSNKLSAKVGVEGEHKNERVGEHSEYEGRGSNHEHDEYSEHRSEWTEQGDVHEGEEEHNEGREHDR